MNLCMDTGCGILPAPAWVSEIVRHAMGPMFPQVGRRPGPQGPITRRQWRHSPQGGDKPRVSGNKLREWRSNDVARAEQNHAAARDITNNTGPLASSTDVMVLWSKPWNGVGRQPPLVVVSHYGSVSMPPEVGARVAAEIAANNPGARVVILRDLHRFGGPRLDRSGDIPVMRHHAWP